MVDPIAVAAALLRAQLPGRHAARGGDLMARVASRGREPRACIVLAGIPLTAQVPPEVQAGATLKLKVAGGHAGARDAADRAAAAGARRRAPPAPPP